MSTPFLSRLSELLIQEHQNGVTQTTHTGLTHTYIHGLSHTVISLFDENILKTLSKLVKRFAR